MTLHFKVNSSNFYFKTLQSDYKYSKTSFGKIMLHGNSGFGKSGL